jgi:hypothetical protein
MFVIYAVLAVFLHLEAPSFPVVLLPLLLPKQEVSIVNC